MDIRQRLAQPLASRVDQDRQLGAAAAPAAALGLRLLAALIGTSPLPLSLGGAKRSPHGFRGFIFAVLWLLLGLVTVLIAWRKKRRLGRWCLYALLAAPCALVHGLWLKTVRCPHCAQIIGADITVCPHCQQDL